MTVVDGNGESQVTVLWLVVYEDKVTINHLMDVFLHYIKMNYGRKRFTDFKRCVYIKDFLCRADDMLIPQFKNI